jgi:hypothetical protein
MSNISRILVLYYITRVLRLVRWCSQTKTNYVRNYRKTKQKQNAN